MYHTNFLTTRDPTWLYFSYLNEETKNEKYETKDKSNKKKNTYAI